MSLDPEKIHAQRYTRIADIIQSGVPQISREWWRRTHESDRPRPLNVAEEESLSRVRVFLRSLARQLEGTDPSAALPRRRATGMGKFRWGQGGDISQLVRDYQTLRLVLIGYLDDALDEPITRDELMALGLNIDQAINAAVSAFSEQEVRVRDDYEQELEQSNRELRRFAHVVAHELKSPLNTQALSIKLLGLQISQETRDRQVTNTLDAAGKAVKQMTHLIGELLRYAEAGSDDPSEAEPTDCTLAVSEAVENLSADIRRSGAEIRYGRLPVVAARPAGLLLLFQNLIGNAIHYRRDKPPRVDIRASDEGDHWLLGVADNGAGIRPEDQKCIFDMFARAHLDLRPRGTGIGLAMCRRFIEDLGGRIWVESEVGVGSTFCFTLPKVGLKVEPTPHPTLGTRLEDQADPTR